MHGRKRRIVSQGFSDHTISASEQYVLDHVRNLCDALLDPSTIGIDGWSSPRNMAMWSKFDNLFLRINMLILIM